MQDVVVQHLDAHHFRHGHLLHGCVAAAAELDVLVEQNLSQCGVHVDIVELGAGFQCPCWHRVDILYKAAIRFFDGVHNPGHVGLIVAVICVAIAWVAVDL